LYFEILFLLHILSSTSPTTFAQGDVTSTAHATRHGTYVPWRDLRRELGQKYVALHNFAALGYGGVQLAHLCSPQWHALVFWPHILSPFGSTLASCDYR
jgi:hypothetical protein